MKMIKINELIYNIRFFLYERKGAIISIGLVRIVYLGFTVLWYLSQRFLVKNDYCALNSLLRYQRDMHLFFDGEKIAGQILSLQQSLLQDCLKAETENTIVQSFIISHEANKIRTLFHGFGEEHLVRMRYPKNVDDPGRQGDLLVLKPYRGENEKGVLFIQYDEGVKRFTSLFDLTRVARHYRLVVEPSTSSYQNVMFFLLYGLDTDVVFEAQFQEDFEYIESVGANFHPIRLGAGDWADPELFTDGSETEKKYDLLMIANWLKWKRHELLFECLAEMKHMVHKVAVIGYPIDGRTLVDIRKEAGTHGVEHLVDFFEKISPENVRQIVQQAKVGVLLSKEEGANRGIYECFFSNVPVVLTAENRGVNRDHINKQTGVLASDEELVNVLMNMVINHQQFGPRPWALNNTGYHNSTRKLNVFLRHLAERAGEDWRSDIFSKHNSPHARYARKDEQAQADEEFVRLKRYIRRT